MDFVNKFKIPACYSIKILSNNTKLAFIDKQFIKIILNFSPNLTNLRCEIDRFDAHIDYMENIKAFIYCEATKDDWDHLGSNLIELKKYIEYEKKRDIDDFNAFLHLVEIEDDKYTSITDSKIIEKTVDYINDAKHEYQSKCDIFSKIYISLGCSINDYEIVWGNENCINLMMESHG